MLVVLSRKDRLLKNQVTRVVNMSAENDNNKFIECPSCKKQIAGLLIRNLNTDHFVCWDCLSEDSKEHYKVIWFPFKPNQIMNCNTP